MIHQRHRQTDRQTDGQTSRRTDDMRSQDRALHYSASRGKTKYKQGNLRHQTPARSCAAMVSQFELTPYTCIVSAIRPTVGNKHDVIHKPEVHNVLQPTAEATRAENLASLDTWFLRYVDGQTHRHTDRTRDRGGGVTELPSNWQIYLRLSLSDADMSLEPDKTATEVELSFEPSTIAPASQPQQPTNCQITIVHGRVIYTP